MHGRRRHDAAGDAIPVQAFAPSSCPAYTERVDPKHIRDFAARDWSAAERAKREYLAERSRDADGLWAFWASQSLFEHMRELQPSFPANVPHGPDLAHQIELKRLLDRARDVFSSR
jgi:hypothetical protein